MDFVRQLVFEHPQQVIEQAWEKMTEGAEGSGSCQWEAKYEV